VTPTVAWVASQDIRDHIYIPKYYGLHIVSELQSLVETHDLYTIGELARSGAISVSTGDEIGKAAYGTGEIPFVRTSDIANWEIKTAPKQGVSKDIYDTYAAKQNVQVGDILFVRDGTYLIGRNCFITEVDRDILYQSHVLKIHVVDSSVISPALLFLALNSPTVQRQIRSKQFTADIIDTLGQRFYELEIPVPRDEQTRSTLENECMQALDIRSKGKALIKHMPELVEQALREGDGGELRSFLDLQTSDRALALNQRAVTSEFGAFTHTWRASDSIENEIYLPKYYDVSIDEELASLEDTCDLVLIGDLLASGALDIASGHEPGKATYGTGSIPFLRTSDFTNWEIAGDPKQGVSRAVYDEYSKKQSLRALDILLVRDGTYLVGSSCIVTEHDAESLYSGGLLRIRTVDGQLSPYLLLALLNSFVVKRQLRSKQFTRDVIDTLGLRLGEVVLPIPKSEQLRAELADAVRETVELRIAARETIRGLAQTIASPE
jgi:hypothetical protein